MQQTVLEKTLKTARIIAGAIMASLLIYILVAEFVVIRSSELQFPQLSILRLALYLISGIEVAIIVFLRRFLVKGTGRLPSAMMNSLKKSDQNPDITAENQETVICQRLLSTTIVTFAISESIAIYGLVLFILGRQRQDLYLLTGFSLFLMVVFFPSSDRWRDELEQLQRDSSAGGFT